MNKSINKVNSYKSVEKAGKYSLLTNSVLTVCMVTALAATIPSDAMAAGTAVEVPFVDNLKETVKDLMTGAGSFVIDAMILAGGGWATVRTSTPAPIVLAILSVFIFEICVSLITK